LAGAAWFSQFVAKFTDLQALEKGHADKLQASREPDFDTDCREYKILPPARQEA
jgi:hypothetical protein